jgi:hypothetical protein
MRLSIVTFCTGEKAHPPAKALTLEDFQAGAAHVKRREQDLNQFLTPAAQLYTGEQLVRLMRGLSALRTTPADTLSAPTGERDEGGCRNPEAPNSQFGLHPSASSLDLWVLSAGYGLIPESRKIAPYECRFATMGTKEIHAWGEILDVPKDFRRTVAQPDNLGLILLGDNYLQACRLGSAVQLGGLTVLFCRQGPAKKVPRLPNLRVVTLSNPEAKRFSCGLVGLKGELAARMLSKLALAPDSPVRIKDPAFDVLTWLHGPARPSPKRRPESCAPIQSVHSASHLRQAWMRLNQSYASFECPYAALRIPEAGKGFRANHMEQHASLTEDRIVELESDVCQRFTVHLTCSHQDYAKANAHWL